MVLFVTLHRSPLSTAPYIDMHNAMHHQHVAVLPMAVCPESVLVKSEHDTISAVIYVTYVRESLNHRSPRLEVHKLRVCVHRKEDVVRNRARGARLAERDLTMIATRLALLQTITTVLRHVCIERRLESVLAKSSAFSQTLYKIPGTQKRFISYRYHCLC